MIRLHGYYRSSAAFRVRAALALKGLAFELVPHHLRKGEQRAADYMQLQPQGLVPALEIDGHVLIQSMAIIEYLDATRPEPPLLPKDEAGRARVRGLAQLVSCDIHPVDNLRVLNRLRRELGQPEPEVVAWYNHWIAEGFEALEKLLAGSPDTGRFCHGDAPGLADLCLVPQVVNAGNFKLDLAPYPTIRRIHAACLALPAFEQGMPHNQPDSEPPAG
ncbi:maleylacetoacetate isomerase [Caulobacter sp. S45]|uniref:maleylacetoacetate isomerase n=1 Tax=Caulobacter sp. S45 TaxID=1641861 RepID=UPI00131D1462|nr:maleylacetoacetate isomerase [Caulobacter sp. S45]